MTIVTRQPPEKKKETRSPGGIDGNGSGVRYTTPEAAGWGSQLRHGSAQRQFGGMANKGNDVKAMQRAPLQLVATRM